MAARVVHYEDIMEYTTHNISAIRGYHDKHNIEKKGHLLTHSSFLGSGAHAAHWTGDNASTWSDLWYSMCPPLSIESWVK